MKMSNNALSVYGQFDQIQQAGIALHKSGFFSDSKSEAQAIVKVMAGAEIGIPPFAAMTGIHIIQGKPAIGSNIIATLVKNDPRYDYRVQTCDVKECVIEWFESGHPVGESSFTIQEAQNAGLTGKDNWKKYTSDMLFARALTRGARRYAPGIFGGSPVYTADELGADTDEDGNIIEGEVMTPKQSNGKPSASDIKPPLPTDAMRNKFHALGTDFYGESWDDERPRLVTWITKKRQPAPTEQITSSNELFRAEMQSLIDGLTNKLDQREEAQELAAE
jgi:hypothetical protein